MTKHRERLSHSVAKLASSTLLLMSAFSPAEGAEGRVDARDIRVLKPGTQATGCEFRGTARADDMERVFKKASRIYGDTVVMKDITTGKDIVVEVYRCSAKGGSK